jgi:Lon-like protease
MVPPPLPPPPPPPVASTGPRMWQLPNPVTVGPTRRRRVARALGMVVTGVISTLILFGVVASQVSVPWVAIEPGSASSAPERIDATGAPSFAVDGDILFVTVRVKRLSALELLMRARDRSVDLVSERDFFGDVTPTESRQQSRDLMVRAKSNAELVALRQLGYQVFENDGVRVESVAAGTAADGKLEQFSVITAVNDEPTPTPQSLIENLAARRAGDAVRLAVEAGDGSDERQVVVTLGRRPDATPGGYLGITTSQHVREASGVPVTVTIDSGDIGGNSAGLAFTLSVIDELTPGSLTGNNRVAVTGTIELDGTVGEIGGIRQKVVAARRSGAQYFLVPRTLEAEARRDAKDLVVLPVSNLTEALEALASIGGNAREVALGVPPGGR